MFADWRARTVSWIVNRYSRLKPDVTIGGPYDPYLLRWYVVPRNRFLNIYVHKFLRSDDDRAHHDHPWLWNFSWLLAGLYDELKMLLGGVEKRTRRVAGDWKLRIGPAPHRLELVNDQPCWTLFITGPRYRVWGFHCPKRWVPWQEFTAPNDPGEIGPGCDAQ